MGTAGRASLLNPRRLSSEKVICRITKEEGLIGKRKHGSCKGEIGEAPKNMVKRDFHADGQDRLWLTGITEFSIPAARAT